MKHPEFTLQSQVCAYLRSQYPKVLFLSDTVASLKLTATQKVRNNRIQKQDFHCPDLIILQPNNTHHGLCIELKAVNIFKKDGTLYKNEHLEAQQRTIADLNARGYFATFAVGFDATKRIIDWYLNL